MAIDKNYSQLVEKIFIEKSITPRETETLVNAMLTGTLSKIRIASVFTAFRFLELSPQLLSTLIDTVKSHAIAVNNLEQKNIVDCSGTGCDVLSRINISTASAFIAAASGATVARFSSKGLTSKLGSLNLLKLLEISCASNEDEIKSDLAMRGISFLDVHDFHPLLRHLSDVRTTLGFRTFIDVIAPLLSPVTLSGQLVGVYQKDLMQIIATCLKDLGRTRALVVYGSSGLDQISVCGPTYLMQLENGKIEESVINPEDFGLKVYDVETLKSADRIQSAKHLMGILKNTAHPAMIETVTLSAGAVLWCAQKCNSIKDGFQIAKENLESGLVYQFFKNHYSSKYTV